MILKFVFSLRVAQFVVFGDFYPYIVIFNYFFVQTLFSENTDSGNTVGEMIVQAHECLGVVLSNLKEVIHRYPSLNSNEILAAAGELISRVKNFSCFDVKSPGDFYLAIDRLALVFGSGWV